MFAQEPEKYAHLEETAESPEFGGRVIAALARQNDLMEKTGRVWIAAELAEALEVTDVDGRQPPSHRPFLGGPAMPNPAVIE